MLCAVDIVVVSLGRQVHTPLPSNTRQLLNHFLMHCRRRCCCCCCCCCCLEIHVFQGVIRGFWFCLCSEILFQTSCQQHTFEVSFFFVCPSREQILMLSLPTISFGINYANVNVLINTTYSVRKGGCRCKSLLVKRQTNARFARENLSHLSKKSGNDEINWTVTKDPFINSFFSIDSTKFASAWNNHVDALVEFSKAKIDYVVCVVSLVIVVTDLIEFVKVWRRRWRWWWWLWWWWW